MTDYVEEIKEQQKRNAEQNRAFIDYYADWVKKTPNEEWSKAQNKLFR